LAVLKKVFNLIESGNIKSATILLKIRSNISMAKNTENNRSENNNGNMTVEEAGRKGGEATSSNHDREFYEEIGSKGGKARARQRDNG
jgi:uncharacterized protein